MSTIELVLNERYFNKDPKSSELGRKIISHGIGLIDELGFEHFTFKKLANRIDSTEASIYRYFENKHKFLVYLIAWYWNWLEFRIDYETNNISDAEHQFQIALRVICEEKKRDQNFPEIDESALYRIVIAESHKTYLTRQVDDINKEGLFRGYKSLCSRIARMFMAIDKSYPYPHSLASTVLEAAHQQLFFAWHLPAMTNIRSQNGQSYVQNYEFLYDLIRKALGCNVQD
jgi:AcrR family transcriptional regulator